MSRQGPNCSTPYTVVRLRREVRDIRLREQGYRSYPHYLKSAHWADVRREYQASGLPQDCFCGETEAIQLHHMTYERVGREELSDLTPLCPTCHAMVHTLEARGEIGLDFTGFINEQRAEQRRAEVEAAAQERLISYLEDVAFIEDLRRRMQQIHKMPSARKLAGASIWRVISSFKGLETKLERVQSKYV